MSATETLVTDTDNGYADEAPPARKSAPARKARATRKATAKAKPKARKREGLSMLDAAHKVLSGRKNPMRCGELIEVLAERKLWKSPGGKTPAATLSAEIGKEITKGKDSRFKKVAPGQFTAS